MTARACLEPVLCKEIPFREVGSIHDGKEVIDAILSESAEGWLSACNCIDNKFGIDSVSRPNTLLRECYAPHQASSRP